MKHLILANEITIIPYTNQPTLKDLQAAVGGVIEEVSLDGGQLIVNEEGLLLNLPVNVIASELVRRHIVGDVVWLTGEDMMK